MKRLLLITATALTACAPATWRLAGDGATALLIPPHAKPEAGIPVRPSADRVTGEVQLTPGTLLQVVLPIRTDNAPPEAPLEVTGSGNSLTVTTSAPSLAGYERDWYRLQPDRTITYLEGERHIGDKTDAVTKPANDYLKLPLPAAAWRLLYKAGSNDYTALLCPGPTDDRCIAIPKGIAINPFIEIALNGKPARINWGTTIGDAIRGTGIKQPADVLPTLRLSRLFQNRATTVQFDPKRPEILALVLTGGETLAW